MGYRILADVTVGIHLLFVLFAVFGGVLAFRFPRAVWIHLPAVLWAAGIEYFDGICPLTHLENHFLRQAGLAGYPGGFIDQYLMPVLYPANLTRQVQILLGTGVLLVNIIIYAAVFYRSARRK
jgi:hypothetical protein